MVSPDNQSSFKIIGKTLFHLFLFWLFSFFIFHVSFFQSKEIGPMPGIFSGWSYEVNPFIFLLCILIFLFLYTFFWQEYLKKDFKQGVEKNRMFVIFSAFLFLIFILLEFLILLFVLGLDISWGTVLNFPVEEIYLFVFIYLLLFPLFDTIRERRKQGRR